MRVAVVVVNESNELRFLPVSRCPLWAQPVQARLAGSGRVWNSEVYDERLNHVVFHDSSGKPIEQVCVASMVAMTFRPGGISTAVLKVPVREILGDSLPSGRYRVTARLVTGGGDGRTLDAGEIVL